MHALHCLLRFTLCCVCGCAQLIAAAAEAELATRVDRLFATWNHADTPGAALAVLRDGKLILSRGYGMANLEYGVPNTTATVFHRPMAGVRSAASEAQPSMCHSSISDRRGCASDLFSQRPCCFGLASMEGTTSLRRHGTRPDCVASKRESAAQIGRRTEWCDREPVTQRGERRGEMLDATLPIDCMTDV